MAISQLSWMQSNAITTFVLLVLRTLHVLHQIRRGSGRRTKNKRTKLRTKPAKTLVVLGSGGHTTEMVKLLSSLSNNNSNKDNNSKNNNSRNKNNSNYQPLSYVIASSDTTSIDRLNEHAASIPPHDGRILTIPRAREVGQSYLTSILTTLYSIASTAHIVLIQTRPDLLLLNGPGTCLPIAIWTFVGRVLGICEGKIIFCESFCRVETLSLTGWILRSCRIVDLFLVHWEEMVGVHGGENCVLVESFIRHSWGLISCECVIIQGPYIYIYNRWWIYTCWRSVYKSLI